VTGTFAADALAKQDDHAWGGSAIDAALSTKDAVARIPEEITGWKRTLAEEYLRSGGGGAAPRPTQPAPAPTAAPPPPQEDGGGNGNNGNGNGNGNGRRD
jgi:hypothetical protein